MTRNCERHVIVCAARIGAVAARLGAARLGAAGLGAAGLGAVGLGAVVLGAAMSGCDGASYGAAPASRFDAMQVVQWKLPKRLHEISGLASLADGELLAHDDERGIVYEIDPTAGSITRSFALGDPPVRDDFEGIAVAGTQVYLLTSDGVLYAAPIGADGEHVDYARIDTGLGRACELEGLAYDAARDVLLAPCKTARSADLTGRVTVFAWSLARRGVDARAGIDLDAHALAGPIGTRAFNPSAIEMASDGSSVWLLAGRQRALAQVGLDGRVTSVERLPKGHRQPEGLALAGPDGFIIADEGGDGHAMLSIYRPR